MTATTNPTYIGKTIFEFLKKPNGSSFDTEQYHNLFEASTQIITRIIIQQNLDKVVTPLQKDRTVDQLLLEIITKPEDFEKDLTYDKSSITTSAQIRYIAETSKAPELSIYSYLLKRGLTLLKSFAEGNSKEYLELLQRIKQTIKAKFNALQYKNKGISYMACSLNSAICYIPDYNDLTIPEISIDKETKIDFILLNILKANEQYYFRLKDLVTIIAKLMMSEKSEVSLDNKETLKTINNNFSNKSDYSNLNIAKESMNFLIKCHSENETLANQSEMALLAYFCKILSGYFSEDILTDEQKRLSLTDCVENFLNDKRFIHLQKGNKIERTTAYTRLKYAQNSLQNAISDLSTEEKLLFIKEYCKHLEKRFMELTGGDKDE